MRLLRAAFLIVTCAALGAGFLLALLLHAVLR